MESISKATDRWSQTYVTNKSKETPPPPRRTEVSPPVAAPSVASTRHSSASAVPSVNATPSSSTLRRFPRPQSSSGTVNIGSRVSTHIDRTTTSRSPSPLKRTYSPAEDATDILPSPHGSVLAKAYGSVLQPKETLATFTCSICSTPFPPDATIYPDPMEADGQTRYLCRPCFEVNGGSKGDCESCHRPVLVLKSEGGFIENSGRLWHKRCFRCEGCFKDISEHPMVDLLGKPSCAECFDTCLKRDTPRKNESPRVERDEKRSNLGGLKRISTGRQGSPALEELTQRLGTLTKSRESSPVLEDRARSFPLDFSSPSRDSPTRSSRYTSPTRDDSPLTDRSRPRANSEFSNSSSIQPGDGSPVRRTYDRIRSPEIDRRGSSPRFPSSPVSPRQSADEAIEEMKRRFLDAARKSPSPTPKPTSPPQKTPQKTPQSRIPIASRDSSSPSFRSRVSNTPSRPDSQFLSFADPSSSSVAPLRTKSSVSCLSSRDSDFLSSELLSTPDPTKHVIDTPAPRSVTSLGSPRQEPDILPRTPDLGSEFSDSTSTTFSSGPPTPPSSSPPQMKDFREEEHEEEVDVVPPTPTPKQKETPTEAAVPTAISPAATCAKCNIALLSVKHGGKFVTVPEDMSSGAPAKMYHPRCFRCSVCDVAFGDNRAGQAVFVRTEAGVCHPDCAPRERTSIRPTRSIPAMRSQSVSSTPASSSRYERPLTAAPATSTNFPKFGGGIACPGCHQSVSPMERGVVPGPAGSRWHSTCLVCGGKNNRARAGRRKKDEPGCGKKLDSAAKTGGDGGVWCRECLV